MAESILFDVAGNIITKLGSLAIRELGFLWGVNDELLKLKDTVSVLEAVILDAEEQQFNSRAVKDWISKLKDAFYDIDDLMDEFSYETLRRQVMAKDGKNAKEVRIFFSKSNQIAFSLKMGHKIKEIRERLKAIDADKTQFRFFERRVDTRDDGWLKKRRETYSFIPEGEVMGRDDEKKAIINLLLNTNAKDDIAVISIVGMGGLGKTALVQSIYNNEEIKEHFELKLWICISEEFDVKMIIEKVIESITKEKPKSLEMDPLQQSLREKIDGKKYLLIMDDVWNENNEKWVDLKRLLMGGAKGSRIVITTRNEQVARTCDTTSMHRLGKLDDKNSWLLFEKMALGGEGARGQLENSKFVDIGKEIVAKLKGVPLAIRTIGRLLYFKKSKSDWLSFKEIELNEVMQQENEMQAILKISHNHLSSNLKQCFAYCALFPKDHEIQKDEVIRQWVAQGFIQPHGIKAIEDIAEDYFLELLWRSFFQDIRNNEWGDIVECKMHDLMHDLACSIVENYVCVLISVDANKPIERRTRHVSYDSSSYKGFTHSKSLIEAKNLRTLYVPDIGNNGIHRKIVPNHLRLRTLVLRFDRVLKELPKSSSKLKHLRYLDLSKHERMKFLLNSITELYNLETLILCGCYNLRELPRDIKNLINLRHLDMSSCYNLTHMPEGLGGLTSLRTMNLFVLGRKNGSGLSELNGLNNLKNVLLIKGLQVCTTANLHKNGNYLKLKPGIRRLKLNWGWKYDKDKFMIGAFDHEEEVLECLEPHSNIQVIDISNYQGVRLCSWLSSDSLGCLVTIQLENCKRLQHLPQFDQFLSLKYLTLKGLDSIEYIGNLNDYLSSSTFFPSLEELTIVNMPNLKGWWKNEISSESSQSSVSFFPTVLPCLSKLYIGSCPQLALIPWHAPLLSTLGLHDVSSKLLENMVIKANGKLVVECSSTRFKLKTLSIFEIEDLEILPKEFFCNLTELEFLEIVNCKNLRLSSLHSVQHRNDEDEDGVQWKELASLRSLTLSEIPKLEYLPKGLQHVTTLQALQIRLCPNLMTLPEWIDNLTSLLSLIIQHCPNLTSLPERMCHLRSLQTFWIRGCPKLKERCKKGIGEDWPKIAHVSDLYIS